MSFSSFCKSVLYPFIINELYPQNGVNPKTRKRDIHNIQCRLKNRYTSESFLARKKTTLCPRTYLTGILTTLISSLL